MVSKEKEQFHAFMSKTLAASTSPFNKKTRIILLENLANAREKS